MLLKVLVYGYVSNVYSSRKLEAACKESVYYIGAARRWLSSMSYPDHNTINRFRGVRLKDALRSLFEEVGGRSRDIAFGSRRAVEHRGDFR